MSDPVETILAVECPACRGATDVAGAAGKYCAGGDFQEDDVFCASRIRAAHAQLSRLQSHDEKVAAAIDETFANRGGLLQRLADSPAQSKSQVERGAGMLPGQRCTRHVHDGIDANRHAFMPIADANWKELGGELRRCPYIAPSPNGDKP